MLEVAADSGGSESLTLVLVFTPEAAAFEVGLRELLRSVSVTSNVSLICADGGGEQVLPLFFSFLLKVFVLHPARLMTDDVRGKYGTPLDSTRPI